MANDLDVNWNSVNQHLDNIEKHCAPARDNNCLQKELQGMSVADMTQTMATYLDHASKQAEKHLPQLDNQAWMTGLMSMKSLQGKGDPGMYKFEQK